MDWTTCIAAATLPALAAGVVWLAIGAVVLGLCRAAAAGERQSLAEPAKPADAPPTPAPRTPYELVASALVNLDVEHVTLFAGDAVDGLRVVSRGHLDARADTEPAELHSEAAAAAVRSGSTIEIGGIAPAPLVAAAPVFRRGRIGGALAVSSQRVSRGRLTFAERRVLRQLAQAAAALRVAERRRPAVRQRRLS